MVLVSYKPLKKHRTTKLMGRVLGLAVVRQLLHAGLCDILPLRGESRMTTVDLITALFYEIDEQLRGIPKHPEVHLWPSEVVTLGLLHALKGGGNRAFYRWLTRDYRVLFPRLPILCESRLYTPSRHIGSYHRQEVGAASCQAERGAVPLSVGL